MMSIAAAMFRREPTSAPRTFVPASPVAFCTKSKCVRSGAREQGQTRRQHISHVIGGWGQADINIEMGSEPGAQARQQQQDSWILRMTASPQYCRGVSRERPSKQV